MFLSTGYTLEAFFWIMLLSLILVSITVFFATPRPEPKILTDFKVKHHIKEKSPEIENEKENDEDIDEDRKLVRRTRKAYLFAIMTVLVVLGSVFMQSTFNLFNDLDEDGLSDV